MFTRYKNNPIIKPNRNISWQSRKLYNAGAIFSNNKYHLFFRAVGDDGNSKIGHAISINGYNFTIKNNPVLTQLEECEKKGIENPRISKINETYYMTYTAFDGESARLHFAISDDFSYWKRQGLMIKNWNLKRAHGFVVPWDKAQRNPVAAKEWSKAGGIFPEFINQQYWMLFGDRNIWHAHSDDGLNWEPVWKPFLTPRIGEYFDNTHLEMGPPPIKTKKGWLVLYHGIDEKKVYRLGFILLDLNDPTKILYRTDKPIFEPQASYELKGIIDITNDSEPKVIFCCGAVLIKDTLQIYYGAGDTYICTATAPIKKILSQLS